MCVFCLVIFWTIYFHAGTQEIRILYMNDFHGFAEPHMTAGGKESVGGIAYLSSCVKRLRREKPSILLAAGDMMQGDNWANFFQGESVISVMNLMGFDAMVVGNHEFDYGQDVLRKRISEAKFPVLGANIRGFDGLEPYTIHELAEVKIGIVGVVTEDTPVSTHPRNVKGLQFLPAADILIRRLGMLRDKVDILVVLSHLGHHADRILAETVPGIDVIVGGHSHTRIETPVVVGDTVILQAWEHAKTLGVIDIMLADGKIVGRNGRLVGINPNAEEKDPGVQQEIERYGRHLDSMFLQVVGKALHDLDGENARNRETNLGNLVADIMREESGADIVIMNGGGIRKSISKGEIRVKDIYSALPFDNYIVAVSLTGREVLETLEHGLSGVERGEGRFPQVSGIRVTYRPSLPPGSRTESVLVDGEPLDPDKVYTVATNDFLAAGGDGYKTFGDAIRERGDFTQTGGVLQSGKIRYSDPSRWIRDIIISHVKSSGMVAPVVEGRIKELRKNSMNSTQAPLGNNMHNSY